jgi:homoserine kinase
VHSATEDRLHQTQRAPLFPEAGHLLAGLVDAGALASCWSGAGPSLLAICDAVSAEQVRSAGDRLLDEVRLPGSSLLLAPDLNGLTITH